MRTITVLIETDSEEPFRLIKDDIETELSCCWNYGHFEKVEISESMQTIEPKNGKWEVVEDYDGDSHYRCSACGEEWFLNEGTPKENNMNYCPNCGARMTE